MPASAQRLRRDEVVYRPLLETNATSPIIMSTRLNDQSEDIALLRELIDEVYRLQQAEKLEAERKSMPVLTGPRSSP